MGGKMKVQARRIKVNLLLNPPRRESDQADLEWQTRYCPER